MESSRLQPWNGKSCLQDQDPYTEPLISTYFRVTFMLMCKLVCLTMLVNCVLNPFKFVLSYILKNENLVCCIMFSVGFGSTVSSPCTESHNLNKYIIIISESLNLLKFNSLKPRQSNIQPYIYLCDTLIFVKLVYCQVSS